MGGHHPRYWNSSYCKATGSTNLRLSPHGMNSNDVIMRFGADGLRYFGPSEHRLEQETSVGAPTGALGGVYFGAMSPPAPWRGACVENGCLARRTGGDRSSSTALNRSGNENRSLSRRRREATCGGRVHTQCSAISHTARRSTDVKAAPTPIRCRTRITEQNGLCGPGEVQCGAQRATTMRRKAINEMTRDARRPSK
jgi:hypothetical protein